jgi:2'-5' RNA ligase
MPFSGPNDPGLPKNVKGKSAKTRRQWVAVWNSVFKRTGDEGAAYKQANGVIKGKKMTTGLRVKSGSEAVLLQSETGAKVMPYVSCDSPECDAPAMWGVETGGETLRFCDDHIDGALGALERNNIPVTSMGPLPMEGARLSLPVPATILALVPSASLAEKLVVPGGIPPDDLHVTLCYLGEVGDDEQEQLAWIVRGLASQLPPVTATLNGVTKFVEVESGKDAVVLNVDSPTLSRFRECIAGTLENLGFPEQSDHGFTPHITISYITDDADMPIAWLPDEPVTFDTLWLWRGEERTGFGLAGDETKVGKFVTIEGKPVFIGGPGQGGGGTSGGSQRSTSRAPSMSEAGKGPLSELEKFMGDRLPVPEDFDEDEVEDMTWDDAELEVVAEVKADIARQLAEETGLSEQECSRFVHQWAETSNDTDMRSLGIQEAASAEFGVPLSDWQLSQIEQAKVRSAPHNEALLPSDAQRNILKMMHGSTQERLKEAGYGPDDTLTLYRGVKFGDKKPNWAEGDTVGVKGNTLESWSISPEVANDFSDGIVLVSNIPVSSIISSARTGLGCLKEGELLALGGNYEALVWRND